MPRFGLAIAVVGLVLAAQVAGGSTRWEDWSGSKSTATEHTTVVTIVEEPTVTTYETISGTTTTSCTTSCTASTESSSPSPSSITASRSTSTPTASSSSSSASSLSSPTSIIAGSSSQASQGTGTGSSQDTSTPRDSTESTVTRLSSTNTNQVTQSADTRATNAADSSSTTSTRFSQGTASVASSSSASSGGAASEGSGGSETVTGDSSSSTTCSSSPIDSASSSDSTSVSSSADSASSGSVSTDSASSDSGSSGSASSSSSTTTPSSAASATGDNPSAPPTPVSGSITTESLTISSTGSDRTLVTVIVTTHTIVSESGSSEAISSNTPSGAKSTVSTGGAQPSGSVSGGPSSTSALIATPVIPSQSATCEYGVMPWCTQATNLLSSYGCLCPYCWAPSELCQANKPSSTSQCPDLGWLCALTTDDSTVVHSMPPGTELVITSGPTTSTWSWWDYISSLHATDDGSHTSDAHFNATLLTSTKIDSEHHTTLFPYRAWECIAGPVCYPPNFDFGCLFPNPLSCANGIGAIFGIWPRPKIPFPPPVGPPELDYQLEATTLGDDEGGQPSASASKSQSTSTCSSTMTYSTCSTTCSTVTVSSSVSESCTSTCTTTSGCSGSDADATTTASACSYSPYWNDPAIASSVSSLLAQFPFSFPETIELTSTSTSTSSFDISTLPSGGCSSGFVTVSGTTVSGAVCTDQLGVPWTSVPSGAILPSSLSSSSSSTPTTTMPFINPTPAKPSSTKTTKSTQSTSIKPSSTKPDWAKNTKDCHDYAGEFDYSKLDDLKRHKKVYCAADAPPKGIEGLFKWGPVGESDGDDTLVHKICQSLVDRKVVLTDDNAQCYRRADKDLAEGTPLRVLFRVSKSIRGCGGDGTVKKCKDDFCDKDFAFADYGVDACVKQFRKLGKCQDKTWGNDAGDYDTAGGTYYNDCVAWTIVAVKVLDAPPNTDDTDPGAP